MKQASLHLTHWQPSSKPDDQQTWKPKCYNAAKLSKTCGKHSHGKLYCSKTCSIYPTCISMFLKYVKRKSGTVPPPFPTCENASSPHKVFTVIQSPWASGKGLEEMNFWKIIFFFNIPTLTSHKNTALRHMESKIEEQKEL